MQKHILVGLVVALALNLLLFPHEITKTEKVNPNCVTRESYLTYPTRTDRAGWNDIGKATVVPGKECATQEVTEVRHLQVWSKESKTVRKDIGYFLIQTAITSVVFAGIIYAVYNLPDDKKNQQKGEKA
jgi:hypothetical protein